MTVEEFSNEFDTLINAYNVSVPTGVNAEPLMFNEYEKSLFLTLALEAFVLDLYSTLLGLDSFETSEESRRCLDALIKLYECKEAEPLNSVLTDKHLHTLYLLPKDIWFIIYELATLDLSKPCMPIASEVVPITHDSYARVKNNPFRGPTSKRILRLDAGGNKVELISTNEIEKYIIRYLKKPSPIILVDLTSNGLSINGSSNTQTCQLNSAVHRKILQLAVQLAVATRTSSTKDKKDT